MRIKFTQSARRHKIGMAHVLFVMLNTEPMFEDGTSDMEPRMSWLGEDDRGVRLHVVAVIQEDEQVLLVIHAMPDYRGRL